MSDPVQAPTAREESRASNPYHHRRVLPAAALAGVESQLHPVLCLGSPTFCLQQGLFLFRQWVIFRYINTAQSIYR